MIIPAPAQLSDFMSGCQQRIEALLESTLQQAQPSERLAQAMAYACLAGGKRIRPILCYGAARALGGSLDDADSSACAVELIHAYSLVHDDLPAMDDDDLRRGKPSVHRAFDEATAILVGDALQSLAFQVLSSESQTPPAARLTMVNTLAVAAGAHGMAGGQSLDFNAVGQAIDVGELESLHRLKTGALISASVRLGALSTGRGDADQLDALAAFAGKLGLAFQVLDDVLDETAETATLGKPSGSDRELGKTTYISLLGLDDARQLVAELTNEAMASLQEFDAGADPLRDLATYLADRRH